MEEIFICTVWSGKKMSKVEVMATDPQDARKRLTKQLKLEGLVENLDFAISLIDPKVETPPPPFIDQGDW